ncbi:GyrI-like domain-containing protein [Lederbergia wuyishanensis]|uniref:Transcriptional regulator YdeE n=1 Tax=Lederbergia wuyishanensis TaxID=1347903 RepID=A0ABU0D4Z4_9BACI|nr:effector binding domain-containing protein [Lederbergia wuyishanensis]MCJ8009569.1 effector binding domain-containing protein [Lederbergia wuyishanensis]MDQ0343475.1 putative transcriptional regulator YdeE [Lederbergia wuyishanensis]
MTIKQKNDAVLITKEAFHAIGIKWEGTFAEAGEGGIREIQIELQKRLKEISGIVDPEIMLGLSYHAIPGGNGFTHYAAVEVEKVEKIPSGMVSIFVPTLTYATCKHYKGQSIESSYNNIYNWISSERLKENYVDHLTHFEKYPMNQHPYSTDPEFTIMIPVTRYYNAIDIC